MLWDADFLLGGAVGSDASHYVLCEVNVSSGPLSPERDRRLVAAVQTLLARAGATGALMPTA